MKKLLLTLLLLSPAGYAHTPLFDCYDNLDDTITCEGGFSDGGSAEGVDIRILDARGKVMQQGELDATGSITFDKPEGEYTVVFAADSQHSVIILGDDIY